MALCSEAILVNGHGAEGLIATLRCKRWGCEICAPFNRSRVIKKARQGEPNAFLTLTCNPHRYEAPAEAAVALKHAWVLLRRRIFTRYGVKNLPFLAVFERTKRGYPHLHILMRAPFIAQKWLSDQMRDLIDAPIVDIRVIQDRGRAAKYVTKYVGKSPERFEGCQRWWRSRNYNEGEDDVMPKVTYGHRWEEVRVTYDQFVQFEVSKGTIIKEICPGYAYYQRWAPHIALYRGTQHRGPPPGVDLD